MARVDLRRRTELAAFALERASRWSGLQAGLAVVYHRVDEVPGDPDRELVPAHARGLFEEQLRHLARRYRLVSASRLRAAALGRRRGQRFPVAITFDDDLPSHVTHALPALLRLQAPATFFLCGASLETPFRFWWEDLQHVVDAKLIEVDALPEVEPSHLAAALRGSPGALGKVAAAIEALSPAARADVAARLGRLTPAAETVLTEDDVRILAQHFEIGFHTLHHDPLPELDDGALRAALQDGRSRLDHIAGTSLATIAYPHGKGDGRVGRYARDAGFAAGFTGRPRPVVAGADALLSGRIEPSFTSAGAFALQLSRALHRARVASPAAPA